MLSVCVSLSTIPKIHSKPSLTYAELAHPQTQNSPLNATTPPIPPQKTLSLQIMKFNSSTVSTILLLLATTTVLALPASESLVERHGGDTCPTCVPTPVENKCDITTSCIRVWAHSGPGPVPYYCACRHGYRADTISASQSSSQWRLPWAGQEGRVFVEPGVACNTLCDRWWLGPQGCQEVKQLDHCL